jgi:hypothetical protein
MRKFWLTALLVLLVLPCVALGQNDQGQNNNSQGGKPRIGATETLAGGALIAFALGSLGYLVIRRRSSHKA